MQVLTAPPPRPKVFFPSLDTLRFFAFLLVFNQHAFLGIFDLKDKTRLATKIVELACNGALGVSFFFVLSGFLITYLLLTEIRSDGAVDVRSFYVRRSLRIWPLYFAVVTYALVVYPLIKRSLGMDPTSASRIWMHYAFLSNFDKIHVLKYFPHLDVVMVGITWSVSVEEQFYLAWPLLFKTIPRSAYRLIFMAAIAVSLAFRYWYRADAVTLGFHTLSVFGDLAIGGLAAFLALESPAFLRRIERFPAWGIISVYVAGFLLLLNDGRLREHEILNVFLRVPETLFFAFVIVEQNFSRHSFKKYSRWSALAKIGTITYGLYLLHLVPIQVMTLLLGRLRLTSIAAQISAGIAAFALSLIVAQLSYRYYERYFLLMKTRFQHVTHD